MREINSGIYRILNIINGKCYVGSSKNLKKRISDHLSAIKRKMHHNPILVKAIEKYGLENFKFEILAKCPSEYLLKLEQYFVDILYSEYNINKIVDPRINIRNNMDRTPLSLMKKKNLGLSDIGKMKGYVEKGYTYSEIANVFNVNSNDVYRWVNGKIGKSLSIDSNVPAKKFNYGYYNIITNDTSYFFKLRDLAESLSLPRQCTLVCDYVKDNKVYKDCYVLFNSENEKEKVEKAKSGELQKDYLEKKYNTMISDLEKIWASRTILYDVTDKKDIIIYSGSIKEIANKFNVNKLKVRYSYKNNILFLKEYKVVKHNKID